MDSYKKYLKYKKKYYNLKSQIGGQTNNLLYIGMSKYFRNNKIDEIKESLCINDTDIQKGIEYKNLIEFNDDSINKKFNAIFITGDYDYTDINLDYLLSKLLDNGRIYFYNLKEPQIIHVTSIFQYKQFKNFEFINYENLSYLSQELAVVYKYFNPEIIEGDETMIIINCNDNTESWFMINDDEIDLDELNYCGIITGTSILERIILIGKDLQKKIINLQDESNVNKKRIECKYSLAYFYILLTGESWYNKFKFYSINHNINKIHNEKIRHLSLEDFISKSKEKYNKIKISNIVIEYIELKKIEKDYTLVKMENPNIDDEQIKIRLSKHSHDGVKFRDYFDKYIKILNTGGLLDDYIKNEKEKVIKHEILNIDEFIENYKEIMPEIDKCSPVNLIIEKIYDQIKLQHIKCDHKLIKLLSKLIECSKYLLDYNVYLSLKL
jgi:hypothetical protein